jgi:hypothetical protein
MEEKQMNVAKVRNRILDSFSKDPLTGRTLIQSEKSAFVGGVLIFLLVLYSNPTVGLLVGAIFTVGWWAYIGVTKPQPNQSQRSDDKES